MARPKANELTARELVVMQVFWKKQEATAEVAHQSLQAAGEELAYVTVANVIRGLVGKDCLQQTNRQRPFTYRVVRSFEQVSKNLVGDLVSRLFEGSREAMLVHLLDRKKLSSEERAYLHRVLQEQESEV